MINPIYFLSSSGWIKFAYAAPPRLQPYPMTTIANVNLLIETHLIRATLEGSGIAAYIPDELTVQAASPYAFAIGGIRVQVEDEDAAAAREIIAAIPPA